jgi:FkbM family methyltransferase
LWEDPLLAVRRRLSFEFNRRRNADWLDQSQVVTLSRSGPGKNGVASRIAVVPREMINQALFLYGSFELSETRLIQAFLRPGMTFLDVGANIGYYTLLASERVGSTGTVHSFEPHAGIRARLHENIRRNGYRNVVVHHEAMAESSGSVPFFVNTFGENQGLSSIVRGAGQHATESVPSINLDDFSARLAPRRVDLIKMDIEGAEPQAIAGGRRLLASPDAPPIIFEAADLEPIADALVPLGYRIMRHHYTLARGLELLDPHSPFDDIFAAYEAPNYVAAKSEAVFDEVLHAANAGRSALLRMIGRI